MSFDQFNLHDEVINGLRDMGFEKPTPIQEACISLIMEGRDVLASAQTGTGKTAAFAIPVLEKLSEKKKQNKTGIRALIITPTRELAGQVDEAFFAIGYHTGISTAKVYGGDDWSRQEKALNKGTNVIVATPGRLLDHMKIHDVDFSNLDFLILDEADRMLDMGFIPDITQIVSKLPKKRQTLLFSATLPQKIIQLAKNMMDNPERVNMAPDNKAAEGVAQGMYYVEERDKLSLVLHLYEMEKWSSAIIFMSTKRAVDKLTRELGRKGASVTSIHGDRTQGEREKALESFRKGEYRVIVATDVMARGIDVDGVSHVINFSVPHDVEDYVHRIGRTARAEATGDALTLVSGQDRRYMENIIKAMSAEIKKLEIPEHLLKGGKESDKAGDDAKRGRDDRPRRGGRPGAQKRSQGGRKTEDASAPAADRRKDAPQKSEESADAAARTESDTTKSQSSDAGSPAEKQADTPQPARRRGRSRPGGNRRPGKAKEKSAEDDKRQPKAGQPEAKAGEEKSPAGDSPADKGGKKQPQRRKPPRKAKGDQGSKDGGRAPQSGRRGRGNAPGKQGPRGRRQLSRKETDRNELFENITSPDMERVNKSVGEKKGVWSKIKGIFGSD